MRLKTKLVLAITLLVFLIAGLLSLVYVSQLLHAAVQQSYDTNKMVANQVRFALQNALEAGLKDRKVDPNNPAQLRNLEAEAVRNNAPLQAVVDSVNRYSLTVYDINIGDRQSTTLLSTNPENEDKPLPVRPNYEAACSCQSDPVHEAGLRPAQGLRRGGAAGAQRRALCHRARGSAHHAAARRLCALALGSRSR